MTVELHLGGGRDIGLVDQRRHDVGEGGIGLEGIEGTLGGAVLIGHVEVPTLVLIA